MKRIENEALFKRVIYYFENVVGRSKFKTVKHFSDEGVRRHSIYKMLRRFQSTKSTNYKKIPGRPATVGTPKVITKIRNLFQKNPSITTKAVGKRVRASQQTVSRLKVKKLGIKSFKKRIAPKYVKDQESRAKSGCLHVYKNQLSKVLLMDDETYVPWDPQDVPGTKYFHAADPKSVSYSHKVKPKAKFAKKILVWQALDEHGNVSDAYISEGTMNKDIYLEECIYARLLPFIDQHHNRSEVIFWPDLATSHYAKNVTTHLKQEKLEFIEKSKNPPNVPQARGIEMFWSLCKAEYSKRSSQPKTLRGFKQIWKKISKEVAEKSAKSVMDKGLKNLRDIGYKGIEGIQL